MTVNRKFGYILLAVTLLLHVSGMAAERKSVTVKTPGTLNSLISGSEKYKITDLKISGRLNADDLALLRDMAGCDKEEEYTKGQLRHLDMTAATLVPGETTYIGNGKNLKITDKNSLPAYLFSNCRIERI